MEHIIISESTSRNPPLIPYVGSKAWDWSDFLTYMEREGWSEAQLVNSDSARVRNTDEILDFLQTWLFFGLLGVACGSKGHRAYVVREIEGPKLIICTKALRAIWRQEKLRRSSDNRDDLTTWQRHLVQCLNVAHSIMVKLALEKVPFLSSPVILGIAALCDFVKKTILNSGSRQSCSFLTSMSSLLLQESMSRSGWCPTDIERFSVGFDIASFYLLSAQPCPDPHRSHANCHTKKCSAYQTDEKDYKRIHAPGCDMTTCQDLPVNITGLHGVLLSGLVPLVHCIELDNGDVALEVIGAKPNVKYVAISHTWSDGFGNPEMNSLYSCQVQRFLRYIMLTDGSASANLPFWIDTLSCPTEPEEATDLAISMMRETYANADKVLVINNHLLSQAKPALCLEALALILSTSWTRRLWTLQEGVLAKELWFQFADESIELGTAIGLAQLELEQFLEADSLEYAALLNGATLLHDQWGKQDQDLSPNILQLLHGELQWRSTSVPTDEPLCIGALLGFSLRDIISVDVDQRQAQLWKLIKHPPRKILFWSGKRLATPGFRWAPQSLLDAPMSYFLDPKLPSATPRMMIGEIGKTETEVIQEGLLFRADTFHLGMWETDIGKGFFLNPVHGPLLWVTRQRHSRIDLPTNIIISPNKNNKGEAALKNLSLVLEDSAEYLLSPTAQGAVSALLVSHNQTSEDNQPLCGDIEDVCQIYPTYFITKEQRQVVNAAVEQCMQALKDREIIASGRVETSLAHEADQSKHTEEIPSEVDSGSSIDDALANDNHFYVNKSAVDGITIENSKILWWMESLQLSLNRQWCLR